MSAEEEMGRLEEEIKECKRCELWKTRTNPVAGEGSLTAKVMFVGEAPGYYEDLKGRPFVGKAGKILDELLESVGLERSEVYIANVLKCRPPGNRNPATVEIRACTPYLDAQMEIIKPTVIATLGNFSLGYIFDKFGLKADKISKIHGKVFKVSTIAGIKKIVPLYHPAVATYNPGMKEVLVDDFKELANCF
jgi:uracil-DNA glycosylase family 4